MAKFDFVKAMDNAAYYSDAALRDGLDLFYEAEESKVLIEPSESNPEGFRMTLKVLTDRESSFLGGTKNKWWVNLVTHHNAAFIEKANEIWTKAGNSLVQITAAGVDSSHYPWLEFAKAAKKGNEPYDPDAKVLKD